MRWAPKGTLRNRSASTSCWRRWSASADPEGERTRPAAPRLGGFFPATHRRGERQVLRSNLLRLEGAHVLRHARERFGDRHGRPGAFLLRARLLLRERAGHADHLEAPIAQVVRLLRVEREDAVREPRVRGRKDRDRALPELACRGDTVTPVRREEPLLRRDRDDRVEE